MTRESAITKWLEGVTNAALEFRPLVYKTNAVPTHNDILAALQALSRLTQFGGFIDENIEEMYAQQVHYALEHMRHRVWNDAQLAGACTAITQTLGSYLHYDPAIGNGISYQTKCFHKTLREVDKAYTRNQRTSLDKPTEVKIWQIPVTCCLTPYYKHTVIKHPQAQPSFKYLTKNPSESYENRISENIFDDC